MLNNWSPCDRIIIVTIYVKEKLLQISEYLLTESVVAAVGVGLQVEAGELQLDPRAGRHAAVDNVIDNIDNVIDNIDNVDALCRYSVDT